MAHPLRRELLKHSSPFSVGVSSEVYRKMVKWVRVLVAKPDDNLSLITGNHMVKGEH